MAKVFLVLATVVGVALAVLLVAVSGFLFGGGPQSMNAGPIAAVAYGAAVIACVAAPVAGFVLNSRGKTGPGLLVAWLPAIVALVLTVMPAPY